MDHNNLSATTRPFSTRLVTWSWRGFFFFPTMTLSYSVPTFVTIRFVFLAMGLVFHFSIYIYILETWTTNQQILFGRGMCFTCGYSIKLAIVLLGTIELQRKRMKSVFIISPLPLYYLFPTLFFIFINWFRISIPLMAFTCWFR